MTTVISAHFGVGLQCRFVEASCGQNRLTSDYAYALADLSLPDPVWPQTGFIVMACNILMT